MKKLVIVFLMLSSIQGFSQSLEKTFKVGKKYINIPIETEQARQHVKFKIDGEVYTFNDIRIAKDTIDYWTFVDVSKYSGKTFSLEFSEQVPGIEKIYQSDQFVGEDELYKEKLRPQIHFTTRRGWTNDPNGMVYYDGEYHLFYQHNPYEINWGNMTWGHTVSKDLLHWEELPIAIEPGELGTIFSGSAVIDYKNTSGFGKKGNHAMLAIYTTDLRKDGKQINQQQNIAYSLDKGRTFTKHEGNPVISAERKFGSGHERDPKVFWYEPNKNWVMILHDGINYSIYNSKDLKKWDRTSYIDAGFWECPELFELPVNGDENNKKWIVYGVQGIYLIGDFDGKKFTPETEMLRYNIGGMTAAQTYNDEPNGRRIQIGWGHADFPEMPFKQTFTFPQEYKLKTTRNGIRLFIEPVEELEKLYTKTYKFENEYIGDELNKKLEEINNPLLHIKAKFQFENATNFVLNINGYNIGYNVATNKLNDVFVPLHNREIEVEVIVDQTLIEVYVDGGLYYWFANHNKGDLDNFKIKLYRSKNGLNPDSKTLVKSLEIHELKSIWD
jgi:fructan beta-fructosidase